MKIMLVDSNFLAYKAKITTGNLQYNGVATGIMFGFINQLLTAAKKVQPDKIVFTWDSKKSKRKEILSCYKEKRRENQTEEEKQGWEEAFEQFNQLRKEILPRIGFNNNFLQSGYEADDLIARYVFDSSSKDKVFICTADDDMLQLLHMASIFNPAKNAFITHGGFYDEYGINPPNWAYVKMIAGCKSDNVPGIDGIGEKTAIKFIKGDLKKSSKNYKKIKDNKETINFNKQLVALPFKGTESLDVKSNNFDMREFLRFCREFGLSSFRKDDNKEQIREYLGKKEDLEYA